MPNEELYGPNAITGSLEDARDIEVKSTTATTTFSVNPDVPPTPEGLQEKPLEDTPKQEETLTPEQQITKEAQEQIKADAEIAETLESKGVDLAAIQAEYEANSSLSQASYEALEKAGFSKTVVDSYIAGIEAMNEKFTSAVHKAAGGVEEYTRICTFVKNLGKAHADTFDNIVETGDLMQIQVALQGYKSQMVAKHGSQNPVFLGGAGGQTVGGFSSSSEMTKAINDPRYGRDKKYTLETRAKIVKTNF